MAAADTYWPDSSCWRPQAQTLHFLPSSRVSRLAVSSAPAGPALRTFTLQCPQSCARALRLLLLALKCLLPVLCALPTTFKTLYISFKTHKTCECSPFLEHLMPPSFSPWLVCAPLLAHQHREFLLAMLIFRPSLLSDLIHSFLRFFCLEHKFHSVLKCSLLSKARDRLLLGPPHFPLQALLAGIEF